MHDRTDSLISLMVELYFSISKSAAILSRSQPCQLASLGARLFVSVRSFADVGGWLARVGDCGFEVDFPVKARASDSFRF